jgi:iron-sulfur cluster assembly protein
MRLSESAIRSPHETPLNRPTPGPGETDPPTFPAEPGRSADRVGVENLDLPGKPADLPPGTESVPHTIGEVDGQNAVRFARALGAEATGLEPATSGETLLASPAFDPQPTRKEVSALLALTDNAVQAVRDIVSASEQVPETGGLRLVAERAGTQANFQLSVVSLPAEDDEVIEEQGARVFLEPEAASLLDDMVLDATVEHNRVAFTIADYVEE